MKVFRIQNKKKKKIKTLFKKNKINKHRVTTDLVDDVEPFTTILQLTSYIMNIYIFLLLLTHFHYIFFRGNKNGV